MNDKPVFSAILLGGFVCIGLLALGYQISKGIIHIKSLDRTVTVKGLSEREVPADIAIWPITFQEAGNDLNDLFSSIQQKNALIVDYLKNLRLQNRGNFRVSPGDFGQTGRGIQWFGHFQIQIFGRFNDYRLFRKCGQHQRSNE